MFLFQTSNQKTVKEVKTIADAIQKLIDSEMNKFDPEKKNEFKKGNVYNSDKTYYVRLDMDADKKNWAWINLWEVSKDKNVDDKKVAWFSNVKDENGKLGKWDGAIDGEDKEICQTLVVNIVNGFKKKEKKETVNDDGFTKEKEKDKEKKKEEPPKPLFGKELDEKLNEFLNGNPKAFNYLLEMKSDAYAKFNDYFGLLGENHTPDYKRLQEIMERINAATGDDAKLKAFTDYIETEITGKNADGTDVYKGGIQTYYQKGIVSADVDLLREEEGDKWDEVKTGKKGLEADRKKYVEEHGKTGKKKETGIEKEDEKKTDDHEVGLDDQPKYVRPSDKEEEKTETAISAFSKYSPVALEDGSYPLPDWFVKLGVESKDDTEETSVKKAWSKLTTEQQQGVIADLATIVKKGTSQYNQENLTKERLVNLIGALAEKYGKQEGEEINAEETEKKEKKADYTSLFKQTGVEGMEKHGPDALKQLQAEYKLNQEQVKQTADNFVNYCASPDGALLKATKFETLEQAVALLEQFLPDEVKNSQ